MLARVHADPEIQKRRIEKLAVVNASEEHEAQLADLHQSQRTDADWQRKIRIVAATLNAPLGGADRGRHTRWHSSRGVVNPQCPFCIEQ
jgi:hypothetical protein